MSAMALMRSLRTLRRTVFCYLTIRALPIFLLSSIEHLLRRRSNIGERGNWQRKRDRWLDLRMTAIRMAVRDHELPVLADCCGSF